MFNRTALWPRIFLRSTGLRFEISPLAWSVMEAFRQCHHQATEAGGVLLGRHLRDGRAIIVDSVTTPLCADRRSRTHFFRDRRYHQEILDEMWHSSDGTCTYLGEWHTHPEAVPIPSVVDLTDWRRRLQVDHYTEPLFFVIVGTQQICVWQGMHISSFTPLLELEK